MYGSMSRLTLQICGLQTDLCMRRGGRDSTVGGCAAPVVHAADMTTTVTHQTIVGDRECETALWAAVQRLTREELGAGLLCLLTDLELQAR